MSHISFLNTYAVPHEHFDPDKEMHNHIDSAIASFTPDNYIQDTHSFKRSLERKNYSTLNSSHLAKILQHAKDNVLPGAFIRLVAEHPNATEELQHQAHRMLGYK